LPFSNYGKAATPYGILSVSTADGTPLYDRAAPDMPRVIEAQNLSHMNRLMSRTVTQGTGRRAAISGRHVAGKTGTTNDFRDAWFVGYAPDIVTGVWVGDDDYAPMDKVTRLNRAGLAKTRKSAGRLAIRHRGCASIVK